MVAVVESNSLDINAYEVSGKMGFGDALLDDLAAVKNEEGFHPFVDGMETR